MNPGIRIGIDIGGTKTAAVAVDARGAVLERIRTETRRGPDGVVAVASEMVQRLTDLVEAPLVGIGIGIPGVVDWSTGRVAHAVNVGVSDLDLGADLSSRFGVPVHVDNDVNAAALGAWAASGSTALSLGYLNVGTGLAAGVVLDGALWRGSQGVVGEIGHISIDPMGDLCPCGQIGCLELKASGSALARSLPVGVTPGVIDVRMLAEDPDVRRAFSHWAEGVAEAVRMLVLSVGVDRVLIGGGAVAFGPLLLDALGDVLEEWAAISPFLAGLRIRERIALVTADSVATVGAALLVEEARVAESAGGKT